MTLRLHKGYVKVSEKSWEVCTAVTWTSLKNNLLLWFQYAFGLSVCSHWAIQRLSRLNFLIVCVGAWQYFQQKGGITLQNLKESCNKSRCSRLTNFLQNFTRVSCYENTSFYGVIIFYYTKLFDSKSHNLIDSYSRFKKPGFNSVLFSRANEVPLLWLQPLQALTRKNSWQLHVSLFSASLSNQCLFLLK